jgi:ABC-2 type transport system permease protein
MFKVLLKKEFMEQKRTSRLLIVAVVFFIVGLISPLLAKYTPVLLRSIPDIPIDLAKLIPEPTLKDAVDQYIKNTNQFGILLVILFTMNVVAQEIERGTAGMLFIKPVRRSALVLAKWLVGMSVMLVGLLAGALACLAYTAILFEPLPIAGFIKLNLLMAVVLGVYLTVSLCASALARTQAMAAAGAFGGLVLLLILGALPRISDYMPGQLINWGSRLLSGGINAGAKSPVTWGALAVALILMAGMLAIACLRLEREEI